MATESDDKPPVDSDAKRPDDRGRSRYTWRLRFEFDGRELHLRSRTRVAMIAPPSLTRRPELGTDAGLWVELVDDKNQPLFHRVVPNALSTRVEHHRPDGTPEVYIGDPQPGEFEILVPDVPTGRQVVLKGTPLDRERADRLDVGSEELARFSLHDDDTDLETPDPEDHDGKGEDE